VSQAYRDLAGIHAKPSEYPPREDVTQGRYHYRCPKILMPAHIFLHFLKSPHGYFHDTWLQRLPKKLNRSVLDEVQQRSGTNQNGSVISRPQPPVAQEPREDDMVFGWGVYIIDGPNLIGLTFLVTIGLFMTTVVCTLMVLLAGTEEQAFGVGQYLVAVLTCGMMAAYFAFENW
jgi:hypothetical protein